MNDMSKKYINCSRNPASCPENEGYGCCKPNPQRMAQGDSAVALEVYLSTTWGSAAMRIEALATWLDQQEENCGLLSIAAADLRAMSAKLYSEPTGEGDSWFADALTSMGEVIPLPTQPPHQDRGEEARASFERWVRSYHEHPEQARLSYTNGCYDDEETQHKWVGYAAALAEAKQQGRTEPEVCPSCFWTNPEQQGPVEAVAEVEQFGETEDARAIQPIGRMPPVGTKLYTAPQVEAKQQDDDDGWEANFRYLLDRSPHTLRSREGGGPENLMQSAILTFTRMEHKLEAKQQGPGEAVAEVVTGGAIDRLPAGRGLPPGTKLYTAPQVEAKRQSEPVSDRCPHGIRNPHPCRECEDSPIPVEAKRKTGDGEAALVDLWRNRANDGYLTGKPEIDSVTKARQEVYFECADELYAVVTEARNRGR